MKNPGSIVLAQNLRPNFSMNKTAGIVPKNRAPPPTIDMYVESTVLKPVWLMRTDI
jgi:hypothetical protein